MLATLAALAAALAVLALAAALAANRAPLTDPPGVLARLARYLGSNVAETGAQARFPELRPILLAAGAGDAATAVAAACRALGWRNVRVDAAAGTVDAEVVTPLLRFTDDVHIRLLPAEGGAIEARVRSASRVGRGDLGANARHVMDLRAELRRAGRLAGGA